MDRKDDPSDISNLGTTILEMLKKILERQDALRHTVHSLANSMGALSNRLALIELKWKARDEKEEKRRKDSEKPSRGDLPDV